jgi:hypothetical protein
MNKWAIRLGALSGFLVVGAAPQAHHAVASIYDLNTEIVLQGELTKLNFRNPHSNVLLKVSNEDGSSTEWILTTPSLQALTRTGLSSSSIKVGELVKATVLPARNGNPAGFIRRLEAADRAFDLVID